MPPVPPTAAAPTSDAPAAVLGHALADAASRAAEEVSWYDVPGVQLLGMVVGGLLLFAAIRSMFGGRR